MHVHCLEPNLELMPRVVGPGGGLNKAIKEKVRSFLQIIGGFFTAREMDPEDCKPEALLEAPLLSGYEQHVQRKERKCCNNINIVTELKKQAVLAGPLVVVSFLQYSLLMISVMFVGHLGELPLASASMASSFSGVTGFSWMLGMGSALETFCGQAYGAKQYHMLGIYMQRAMLVLMLMCIPISLIWAYTQQIFLNFGQDPDISMRAGVYARWLIPSIFPYGLLQCQLRFLQAQNNVLPLMISTGATSLLHVIVCWLLVQQFGLGSEGAALSSAISYWINVFILAVYIKTSSTCQHTWTGFSKEGAKNLLNFLTLGIPSAVMVCMEYWSYEFLVLMSGLLPNAKLETSTMSVSLNTSGLVFRIAFGFGSAVSTRVANELGAGRPRNARLAVQVVIFLAILEGLLLSLIAVSVRNVWGYLYTSEEEVVKYLGSIMPVLATSNFMDSIQGVLSGAARGCGWQKIGAFVNLGAYYLLGLPCAFMLTFLFHFGAKGLWMGIICGSASQALLLLVITIRTDWEKEAKKAMDRLSASNVVTMSVD